MYLLDAVYKNTTKYLATTKSWQHVLFSRARWFIPEEQQTVYLTFDDGPTPFITEWVLNLLEQYQAKATFFCIGKNVARYPNIVNQIIQQGHRIGNHTYSHYSGWQTSAFNYLHDVKQCSHLLNSPLFRPPYGQISPGQLTALLNNKQWLLPSACNQVHDVYIIMWSIIAFDFDKALHWQDCLRYVMQPKLLLHPSKSPIIVFHDSEKAFAHLREVLPRLLDFLASHNIDCRPIS